MRPHSQVLWVRTSTYLFSEGHYSIPNSKQISGDWVGSGSWQAYYEEIAKGTKVSLSEHGFLVIAAPWKETTVDCTIIIEFQMESKAHVNQGGKSYGVWTGVNEMYGQVSRILCQRWQGDAWDHGAHSPFAVFPSRWKIFFLHFCRTK